MEMIEKFIDANILNNPIGAICFIVFLLVVILPLIIGKERLPGHYLEIAVGVGVLAIVCFFAIGYKGIPENGGGGEGPNGNGNPEVEQKVEGGRNVTAGTIGEGAQVEINTGSQSGSSN